MIAAAVRRFFTESDGTRAVVLRAAWELLIARLSPEEMALRDVRASLAPAQPRDAMVRTDPAETARILTAVARRLPFHTTCLDRSLALYRMLRRDRIEARLRIGVKRDARSIAAHAWVEHRGVLLLGSEAEEYGVLDPPSESCENDR